MKEVYIKFFGRFVLWGFFFPPENLLGYINNLFRFGFFCRKTSRFTCRTYKSSKIVCNSSDSNLLKQFKYLCITSLTPPQQGSKPRNILQIWILGCQEDSLYLWKISIMFKHWWSPLYKETTYFAFYHLLFSHLQSTTQLFFTMSPDSSTKHLQELVLCFHFSFIFKHRLKKLGTIESKRKTCIYCKYNVFPSSVWYMGNCRWKLPWEADLTSFELLLEQVRRFQYNKSAGKENLQQTPSLPYNCKNDLKEKYSNFVQTTRGWRIRKNYSSFSVAHNLGTFRIHSHPHPYCYSKFMPWY